MYSGFPLNQLPLLRCLHDGASLRAEESSGESADGRIREGVLRCTGCGASFPVETGIVRMLDEERLDATSRHERRRRDEESASYHTFVADPIGSAMEMRPMLAALGTGSAGATFELGCGTGRYTLALAGSCEALVAVDFSGASLALLARRLPAHAPVALVQADVARLRLAPGAFRRGLSTLVSNLPSASSRAAMYRLAAEALRPDGRFVFGTHFFSLVQRLRGVPKEGVYAEGGIYRCYFGRREIRAEVRPFFREVEARPVQIPVPLARRLRLPVVPLSQGLGRIPVFNQFGNLLLVAADGPVPPAPRAPAAARRPGPTAARLAGA